MSTEMPWLRVHGVQRRKHRVAGVYVADLPPPGMLACGLALRRALARLWLAAAIMTLLCIGALNSRRMLMFGIDTDKPRERRHGKRL